MDGLLVPQLQSSSEVLLPLFNLVLRVRLVGDEIVVKGKAYGVRSIRVDGNDALAVYSAVRAAREMAITEQRPILIEALASAGARIPDMYDDGVVFVAGVRSEMGVIVRNNS
ncbi:2-oxoisovalerate dehydrogenase subunit alpha 1, mitochondrial, partial [Linum grandiflorum]